MNQESSDAVFGVEYLQAEASNGGLDMEFRQLQPGIMRTSSWTISSSLCHLQYLSSSLAVEAVGCYPPGYAGLNACIDGMVLSENGVIADDGEWLLLQPGAESVANNALAVGGVLILLIPEALLKSYIDAAKPGLQLPKASAIGLHPGPRRAQALREIAERWHSSPDERSGVHASDAIISMLLDVMAERMSYLEVARHPAYKARLLAYRRARHYIDEHFAEPITIPELCSHAGVTQATLGRIFKSEMGMSPRAYLGSRRLSAVRSALQSGEYERDSVSKIGVDCGIRHFGRLSKEFKHFYGVSPTEFRAQIRSDRA